MSQRSGSVWLRLLSTTPDPTIDDPNLLFRFALLLHGEPAAAGAAVVAAIQHCGARIAKIRDEKRRRELLLEEIVKHSPPSNQTPVEHLEFLELEETVAAVSDFGSELVTAIARLPDPLRLVAAYFYSGFFPADELHKVLGWSLSKTANTLQHARNELLKSRHNPSATPEP